MKAIPLELTTDVVTSYDQTKTTVLGRAAKKTLTALQGGKTVVGTPLNTFSDDITDNALTPFRMCVSRNGHELHFITIPATGLGSMALYDVNDTTGVKSYVGKLQFQLPVTTHTIRTVRLVNDSGATGWRIIVGTLGTSAPLGGLFSLENIAKTDFTPGIPITIPVATAIGQKAVYWHQETGGTNNLQVMQGFGIEDDANLSGTKLVAVNGLVASPNFYTFDYGNAITSVAAGGITTDWYVSKTGTITGLTGPFLLLNNIQMCAPDASSGIIASLQGQTCLFLPGSTGFGFGKISELTSGATSWPSYTTINVNDVANTNTALTPLTAHFSQTIQRILFQLSSNNWVSKRAVNNEYEVQFGDSNNSQYRTSQPIAFYEFGAVSIASTYVRNGWVYIACSTAGQIGTMAFDLRSVWEYDYSSIISKVIDVSGLNFIGLSILTPIRSFGKFWYRQSGFGSATGGWIAIPEDRDLSGIVNTTGQIQIKFQPRMQRDSVTTPLQIIESHLICDSVNAMSEYWEFSREWSQPSSPTRSAFRLKKAYSSSVPTLYYRAYDLTNVLVASKNSSADASLFEYSTDNGTTWNPLGTIPNTVGTLIRFNFATPPGVDIRPSIRES